MQRLELFFDDLNAAGMEKVLKFCGGDNGNYDIFPLAVIETEDSEPKGEEEA